MIDTEVRYNLENFAVGEYSDQAMRDTAVVSLAVRKWLEDENLDAFTVNFLNITKASGIPVVPFLEASKAMAEGKGYAGEGDVLTAALTGALMAVFPETTFTEMFCPDWKREPDISESYGGSQTRFVFRKSRFAGKTISIYRRG